MRDEREWLSQEALKRIEAEVQVKGPGIVRRARIVRRAQQVLGVITAGAIATGVAIVFSPDPKPIGETEIAAVKPCSGRAAPQVQSEQRAGGEIAFELGQVAGAVLEPGSRGAVLEASECRTVFALEEGRIRVHARDLAGGELIVKAGERSVTVHGTIFSVEHTAERFAVEVTEGVVEVSGHPKRLVAGDKLEERIELAEVEEEEPEEEPEAVVEPDRKSPRKRSQHKARPSKKRSKARVSRSFDLDLQKTSEPEAEPEETIIPPIEQHEIAPPVPQVESPEDLVRLAGKLRNRGDLKGARRMYRRAGALEGPTAEAAWIALARMEIELSRGTAALEALRDHARRFSGGSLAVEASWLRVQGHQVAGDRSAAEREARALIRRWPATEQARSAKAWLERSD